MEVRQGFLVTDGAPDPPGQSRVSLATVRALAAAGCRAAVTVSSPNSLAGASRFCHRRVPVPAIREGGYAEAVRAELERGRYLAVLPTSDSALLALGSPGAHMLDKLQLARWAEQAGVSSPPTEVFQHAEGLVAAGHRFDYPVAVKRAGGKPVRRANRPDDLRQWSGKPGPLLVQPYLEEPVVAVAGVMWRGSPMGLAHHRTLRKWPPEGGRTCAALTVAPDRDLEERTCALLAGYDGIFHVQFCGGFLLDVNTRPYGTLMLSVAAGVNPVDIYARLLQGERLALARARPGTIWRWAEADVRYAAWALRRGRIGIREFARIVLPQPGAAPGGTWWWRDPGPVLPRVRYGLQARRWRRPVAEGA
jgi:hypothetical protein